MGSDPVGKAIVSLHANGIGARRGYPGDIMPHITRPVVAINIHKADPAGMTVVAEVCAPMSMGVYACEDLADRIEKCWTQMGYTVTYGGHKFDGKSGLYQMSVYGYWAYPTEETEET